MELPSEHPEDESCASTEFIHFISIFSNFQISFLLKNQKKTHFFFSFSPTTTLIQDIIKKIVSS